jgi:ABC-type nitrate/sulfonate/bicarbonate transport system substrate-binding protein
VGGSSHFLIFTGHIRWLLLLAVSLFLTSSITQASSEGDGLETVTMQLKWRHQFQLAGYYAAIDQGYYREAGLNVELKEASPAMDPVKVVLEGGAEYGVGTSELLLLP